MALVAEDRVAACLVGQQVRCGGKLLRKLAEAPGNTQLLFYCAFGERSAMAVQAAQDAGIASARHIEGGIAAWKKAGGALG